MSETNGGNESGKQSFVARGNTHKLNNTCAHGGTAKGQEAEAAVGDDLRIILENFNMNKGVVNKGVVKKARARILKTLSPILGRGNESAVVSELYAQSARALLDGDIMQARVQWFVAFIFQRYVTLEQTGGVPDESRNSSNARKFTRLIANYIPCDCLVEVQRSLEGTANKVACNVCYVDIPILESFRCSQCKKQTYCSEECQLKIWPQHKKVCKMVAANRKFREQADEKNKEEHPDEESATEQESSSTS